MISKKLKLLVCLVIVVSLVNVISPQSFALIFSDTSSHWGKTYIDRMTELGIMDYSSTTYFYPNAYFKRKEAAKSVCMLFKEKTLTSSPHPFTDVPTSNAYSKYVKWVYDNGVMNGTATNTFEPDTYIKRQDMCVVLYNLYFSRVGVPYKPYYSKVTFSDDSNISAYAKTKIYELQKIGIVSGDGGAFRPKDYITRAEVASLLYKTWSYSMILSTPQQEQLMSNLCWAACAKVMAEYRYTGSKTQSQIHYYIKPDGSNAGAQYTELADAATWATYNNIEHYGTGIMSSNSIIEEISRYRPITLLHNIYGSDAQWHGHFMVCIGYVKSFTGTDDYGLFFYNTLGNKYHWMSYDEYLNGTDPDFLGWEYSFSVYSEE